MTPLLQQVIQFLRDNPKDVRIVRRLTDQEEMVAPSEEGGAGRAMLVPEPDKPNEFGVYPVPPSLKETPFTHFIDGIQHAHLLYYLCTEQGFLPVVYGYISAIVLERQDRYLMPLQDFWECQEALYLPAEWADVDILTQRGISVHDTFERVAPTHFSFDTLLIKAGGTVARKRDQLERRLAERWINERGLNPNDWLLVDGSIADLVVNQPLRRALRVVGVSKTHHTAYFSGESLNRIYSMQAHERSSLFRPILPNAQQVPEVYSWYLRLRWAEGSAPAFGLVRIEMPLAEETLRCVDEVSAWLIQEARPLSLPDPRYDRLIYPFRMCEQFLRSRAPSHAVIETAMACVHG